MAKLNISQILAMESMSNVDDTESTKIKEYKEKNYTATMEGLFDFFRKEKESPKKKPVDPKIHAQELLDGSKVTIHLMTNSIDQEIKYIQELIEKGLPLFEKDMERMRKCFKFVIDNHADILDKLDKLVDISYPDPSYNLSKAISGSEFSTFYVAFRDLATNKENQMKIGAFAGNIKFNKIFNKEITDEEKEKYKKLYSLNEAIPSLDFIIPKNRAARDQTRVELGKGDERLKALISLNLELIEKGYAICAPEDVDALYGLANRADKLTHPKLYGNGDEYGMANITYHSLSYLYQLYRGFSISFIKNYTAH